MKTFKKSMMNRLSKMSYQLLKNKMLKMKSNR